jgi:hypothetical protein
LVVRRPVGIGSPHWVVPGWNRHITCAPWVRSSVTQGRVREGVVDLARPLTIGLAEFRFSDASRSVALS